MLSVKFKLDTVVFIGERSVDLIVDKLVPPPQETERRVHILNDTPTQWAARCAKAGAQGSTVVRPGGSAANICASFSDAMTFPPNSLAFLFNQAPLVSSLQAPLYWPGYCPSRTDLAARLVLLPQQQIEPLRPELPGSIVLRDPGTGRAYRIILRQIAKSQEISIRQEFEMLGRSSPRLGIVLRSDHLDCLPSPLPDTVALVAVLASDIFPPPQRLWKLARTRPVLLFGDVTTIREYIRRGNVGQAQAGSAQLECVGMDEDRSCFVFRPNGGSQELQVTSVDCECDLGAGDAYIGGYLAVRLQGESPEAAHRMGCMQARKVLSSLGARLPRIRDLASILPNIGRQSPGRDEAAIYAGIRMSPGIVLITGGQTGVDQLAAEEARRSKLPVHLVLPKGGRTESGRLSTTARNLAGCRLWELESRSYRYRTWATVYFSDAVILIDPANSEGSGAARLAAEYFARPVVEIDLTKAPTDTARLMSKFLATGGMRVLLVAGNRGSLLSRSTVARVRQHLQYIIYAIILNNVKILEGQFGGFPRISCSAEFLPAPHSLLADLAKTLPFIGLPSNIPLAGFRPRDIASGLAAGRLSHGLTWPTLLPPRFLKRARVSPLGIAPVFYGFLLRNSWNRLKRARIALQYDVQPGLVSAGLLDKAGETFHISGQAESWLTCDLADAAYDTWSTGATAGSYGLTNLYPSHWESLSYVNLKFS